MTNLVEIQRLFRDAVFESGAEQTAMQSLSQHVNSSAGLSSMQHLQIYQRAVVGTLERALGQIYPVCQRLVGEEFFGAMARVFIRQHPSLSPDLADYGQAFGRFVGAFEPARELTYLADVAHLEWRWHRAFNAPDEPALNPAALDAVEPADVGQLIFRLPASAGLLQSPYPIKRIWQVNQPHWSGDQSVDLGSGGASMIIWRKDTDVRIDEIDDTVWTLLSMVQRGSTMNELAEIADLDQALPMCVQNGWIGGFRVVHDE